MIWGAIGAAGALASSALVLALRERSRRLKAELETTAAERDQAKAAIEGLRVDLEQINLEVRRLQALTSPLPMDSERLWPGLEDWSEGRLLDLAARLVYVRPLIPYPYWRFDADWDSRDFSFALRRRVWQAFHHRQLDSALEMKWYRDIQLVLHLRNDIGRQLFVTGTIDPNEFAWLETVLQPGMTFLDAGANEGIYSLFAAAHVGAEGKVWSFEPSQRDHRRLIENLERNHLSQITPFQIALGANDVETTLSVAREEHSGHNTLGHFVYDGVSSDRRETVALLRLDSLVRQEGLTRLDVVKADIEGAEFAFLQGADEVLRKFRPILLLEFAGASLRAQGASPEQMAGHLRSLNYTLYTFDSNSGLPELAGLDLASWSHNVIAWPAERPMPFGTD